MTMTIERTETKSAAATLYISERVYARAMQGPYDDRWSVGLYYRPAEGESARLFFGCDFATEGEAFTAARGRLELLRRELLAIDLADCAVTP